VTREVLARAARLRVVGRAGVGVDNVDVAAATERGVIVMNAPEGNTLSTAEHAISMLLALIRRIPEADRTMKEGRWEKKSIVGAELYDKTLGVIGLGKIGGAVVARMKAFGMKALAHDPFITPAAAEKLGVELAEIDDVCRRADAVTIHAPLNAETRGLIDARRLALMKPTAAIVNCARGGIVNETDLIEALRARRIAGAALDVFETEPLPADHPLRSLAASTPEAQEKVARAVAAQVIEALRGGPVRNAVNYPSLDAREIERLRPTLDLCERLGAFVCGYCPAPVDRLEFFYSGTPAEYPLEPMTRALLKGFLEPQVPHGVNYVNAPHLATARGVEVVESRSTETGDYSGLITVVARGAGDRVDRISGTLFHGRDPRLVAINDKHFEARPEGNLIVLENRDVPGVIGAVGTLLGARAVNIANMTWGRPKPGADAITVINVDQAPPADAIEGLRALPNVVSVKSIVI
jgi:D-3-phosphoglycerate dehydrogenase